MTSLARTRTPARLSDDSLREQTLPLCLSRADPVPIVFKSADSKEVSQRKPDFVRTILSAAHATHKDTNERKKTEKEGEIGTKPTKAFLWPQVLSCEEMKTSRLPISKAAGEILDSKWLFTGEEKLGNIMGEPITPGSMLDQTMSRAKRSRSETIGADTSRSKRARISADSLDWSGGTFLPP